MPKPAGLTGGERVAPPDPEQRFGFHTTLSDIRLLLPGETRARGDEELLGKLAEHAFDVASLSEQGVLLFRSVISTDKPDAYRTRMDKSSLTNFAAHAEEGRSVLYGHDTYLIVGRSFQGNFVGGGNPRVQSMAYVPLGLNLAGVSTDEVVRGLRTGLLRDVSVGFFGAEYRCTICGLSLWDRDCPHIPGRKYKRDEESDEETAYALVMNAQLAEYSLVFDGATPGATVLGLKALREAEAGRLTPLEARLLEAEFRIALPGVRDVWALKGGRAADDNTEENVAKFDTKGVVRLDTSKLTGEQRSALGAIDGFGELCAPLEGAADPLTSTPHEALRELLAEYGHGVVGDPVGALRNVLEQHKTRGEEIATLKPKADDGEQYRRDLIEEALREGVRAHGDKLKRQALLERSSTTLDEIKEFRDEWRALGDRELTGGRQTVENDQSPRAHANGRPRIRVGGR